MTESRFFKSDSSFTLKELAKISGADIGREVSSDTSFSSVAPIETATSCDITACYDKKLKSAIKDIKAGVCVTTAELAPFFSDKVSLLIAKDARKAFALIIRALYPIKKPVPFISDKAFISPSAKIGEGVRIEAGAFIGDEAEIGDFCYIAPNAVIGEKVKVGEGSWIGSCASVHFATIGKQVKIYSGARIGEDGFGFVSSAEGHLKIPQIGSVIIGDFVEVGANTCIDRGAMVDTVISDGTIIDNLVQIGHNNTIGKACVIVSQVGIAGSCNLGDFVVLAGQVGVKDHIKIGSGTQVAAQSGIMHDIAPMQTVMGYPAVPVKDFLRQTVTLQKLTKKG